MENYEDEIRPTLARFCGWSWDDKRIYDSANEMRYQRLSGNRCQLSRILPDPLHNPADAWALQKALVDEGYTVWFDKTLAGYGCDIDAAMEIQWVGTMEAALVLAAYAVVKENSDPKKHLPGFRVWKPLDVGGLRLYRVTQSFPNHPDWKREFVVAAKTPTHARELVETAHKDAIFSEEPYYDGYALEVYMPADWWENGAPTEGAKENSPP